MLAASTLHACSSLEGRLFVLAAHLGLQPTEAIGFPVDELRATGQRGMNFSNPAPHLLDDESIIGMTLRHRAQLADVHGLAEVQPHIPNAQRFKKSQNSILTHSTLDSARGELGAGNLLTIKELLGYFATPDNKPEILNRGIISFSIGRPFIKLVACKQWPPQKP